MTTLTIQLPNGAVFNDVSVTPVGKNLYRLEEDVYCIFAVDSEEELDSLPRFGDIARMTAIDSKTVLFESVHERAAMKRFDILLNREQIEAPELKAVLETIVRNNGYWEQYLGGFLLISLPETCGFDPLSEINAVIKALSNA